MRKPIIAGNWKMNKTAAEAEALIAELKPLVVKSKPEVVICVPYTDLWAAKAAIAGSKIKLGAENVAWADSGAFTGEISAAMLKEIGVEKIDVCPYCTACGEKLFFSYRYENQTGYRHRAVVKI